MSHNNGTLILLRGVSGSGKSTLAQTLTETNIAADYYFYNARWEAGRWIFSDHYDFDSKVLHKAHLWCQNMVNSWMNNRLSNLIVVHNTFTKKSDMNPYINMANSHNYMLTSLIVENRHGNKNVHNVPEEVLDKQLLALSSSIKLI